MSAIFKEVVLRWRGKEYRVTPRMELINKIEQEVSLSKIAERILGKEIPISLLALVMCRYLEYAGVRDVTVDEVYVELLAEGPEMIGEVAKAVIVAAFPNLGKAMAPTATPTTPARGKGKRSSAK